MQIVYYVHESFFFNDTATTEIYTLSLHDALPIYPGLHHQREGRPRQRRERVPQPRGRRVEAVRRRLQAGEGDRKSTRLNSSHANISYAVFCLKKKKKISYHLSKYTTYQTTTSTHQ